MQGHESAKEKERRGVERLSPAVFTGTLSFIMLKFYNP